MQAPRSLHRCSPTPPQLPSSRPPPRLSPVSVTPAATLRPRPRACPTFRRLAALRHALGRRAHAQQTSRSSAMQAGSPLLVPRNSRPSLLSKASPCRDSRPSSKCGVGAARVPILSASVSRISITPAARRGRMRGWRCGSRRARRARTRRRAGRRTSALPRGRSGPPQKSNGLLGGCC